MCCIKIILVLLNENSNIISVNQSDAFLNMTRCDITTMPECFLWLPGCLYAVAKVFLVCSYAVASWFPQVNQPFKTYLIFKMHICGIRFLTIEI